MNIGLGLENPIGGQVNCKVSYNYKSFITFPYASKVYINHVLGIVQLCQVVLVWSYELAMTKSR